MKKKRVIILIIIILFIIAGVFLILKETVLKTKTNGIDNNPVEINTKNKISFKDIILNNNDLIESEPTLSMSSSYSKDKDGLYSSTLTNSGEPTYYFRGNVENNYVSFAGMSWRIVRINEDGTVRLILSDGINNNKEYSFCETGNECIDKGNMYFSESNIKKVLDDWYKTNLEKFNNKIATGNYFCEEAKVRPRNDSSSYNAVTVETDEYNPNFKCSTDGNGKGLVNTNIGLITYDEIAYAGGYYTYKNNTFYLGSNLMSMSPAGVSIYNDNMIYAFVWSTLDEGDLNYTITYFGNSQRPVINLKANVTVTGTGISTDPYVIE